MMHRIVVTISADKEVRSKNFAEELEAVIGQYWLEEGKDTACLISVSEHPLQLGLSSPTDDKP